MAKQQEFHSLLKQRIAENIDESLPYGATINDCIQDSYQLGEWKELLNDEQDQIVLDHIAADIQSSVIQLIVGVPSSSFLSLRRALELAVSSVYFSAYPVERGLWRSGKRDISWTEFTNEATGVFSSPFLKAFCENIEEKEVENIKLIRRQAVDLYRSLSEITHGNIPFVTGADISLRFRKDDLGAWVEGFHVFRDMFHVLHAFRYLSGAPTEKRQLLIDLVQDRLMNWPTIRSLVGINVKGVDG